MVNLILGRNEAGKSTVSHSIAFAYFGCDDRGKNPDHLISLGEESAEVWIESDKATIIRTKRRDQTSTIQLVRPGVPPIKLNQTELTELLGLQFDVFTSLYLTGHFASLSNAKCFEVVSSLAKLDRLALMSELYQGPLPTKVKLDNPRASATSIASERRALQNQLNSDRGNLTQIDKQLLSFAELGDADQLKRERDQLKAQSDLWDLYLRNLNQYQMSLSVAREADAQNVALVARRERLELEHRALGSEPTIPDVTGVAEEIKTLESQMLAMPMEPEPVHDLQGQSCTRCGQIVSEKARESIIAEKNAKITQYNIRAREVLTQNNEIKSKVNLLRERLVANDRSYTKQLDWIGEDHRYSQEIAALKPKHVETPTPPIVPPGDEKSVRDRFQEVNAKLQAAGMLSGRKEALQQQKAVIEKSITEKETNEALLRRVEAALVDLPRLEVERTLDLLKIKEVSVRLIDGELEFFNEIGVPYLSLSSGRKLKIDLLLMTKLRAFTKYRPPFVFLDNADLIDEYTQYIPPDTQVMIAKVDASVPTVKVVPWAA
jgi:hypothetical protein